jgi:hypothetical protein
MGETSNLQREIQEHYIGNKPFTNNSNPQLVWSKTITGKQSDIKKQADAIRKMFQEDSDGVLYRLQSRLPLGGITWG